ncbi:mitochondrial carrier protein [Sphaerosporella brunnea]|uniref:Mitochondrial thiamine pyrophosphate carrier 1 n=1 Tax=Sphaerosporella brunnea TaxID=1250544 RepID=A0A5J5EWV1_9PEZI|nr:mitochondrial carrier protein [Sphaerosporella brunnea]
MPEALTLKGHDQSTVAASTVQTPEDAAPITATRRPLARSPRDKQSLDYMLRSGLAGGLAGCAAKTLIAPLDRVKILFQASNPQFLKYTGSWKGVFYAVQDIRRNEGLLGLYRGHSATLLRIFPYAAIKFAAYEQIRNVLIKSKEQETPLRRLAAGSLAGVTSVFFTYPLEVVRVRLAFETGKDRRMGLRDLCRTIYHERHTSYGVLGGISNFYRGFTPTVLGMLPYAGVSFLCHDIACDWLRTLKFARYDNHALEKDGKSVLKVWAELVGGGLAGMAGQTASYPLEVIRRRMQVRGAMGDQRFPGIVETAAMIWRERRLRGFFVGLSIGYAKVIPMVATSFLVYDRAKLYLGIA